MKLHMTEEAVQKPSVEELGIPMGDEIGVSRGTLRSLYRIAGAYGHSLVDTRLLGKFLGKYRTVQVDLETDITVYDREIEGIKTISPRVVGFDGNLPGFDEKAVAEMQRFGLLYLRNRARRKRNIPIPQQDLRPFPEGIEDVFVGLDSKVSLLYIPIPHDPSNQVIALLVENMPEGVDLSKYTKEEIKIIEDNIKLVNTTCGKNYFLPR